MAWNASVGLSMNFSKQESSIQIRKKLFIEQLFKKGGKSNVFGERLRSTGEGLAPDAVDTNPDWRPGEEPGEGPGQVELAMCGRVSIRSRKSTTDCSMWEMKSLKLTFFY